VHFSALLSNSEFSKLTKYWPLKKRVGDNDCFPTICSTVTTELSYQIC
jgi:hypothetical protein